MMDYESKARLAHLHDMSLVACTIRLRAARYVTGLAAKDLAATCRDLQADPIQRRERGLLSFAGSDAVPLPRAPH